MARRPTAAILNLPCCCPACRRTPTASIAAVQALQDAGALLVGKATLHEIGESAGCRCTVGLD